jgi:hypothetical protein
VVHIQGEKLTDHLRCVPHLQRSFSSIPTDKQPIRPLAIPQCAADQNNQEQNRRGD